MEKKNNISDFNSPRQQPSSQVHSPEPSRKWREQDDERTKALVWERERRENKVRNSLDNSKLNRKKVEYKDYLKELRL